MHASKLCLSAGLGLYTGSAVAAALPAEAPGGTQDAAPLAPPAPPGVTPQEGAAGSALADPPHPTAQEEAPPTTGGGSAWKPLSSAAGSVAGRALACFACVLQSACKCKCACLGWSTAVRAWPCFCALPVNQRLLRILAVDQIDYYYLSHENLHHQYVHTIRPQLAGAGVIHTQHLRPSLFWLAA